MKKKRKIVVACICIALSVIILAGVVLGAVVLGDKLVSMGINSPISLFWRMPKSYIKNKLIEEIPLGSSAEDVLEEIEEHDEWEIATAFPLVDGGIIYHSDGTSNWGPIEPGDCIVGSQYIPVTIQHSWWRFTDVYFAFDENDKLVDIAIRKMFLVE